MDEMERIWCCRFLVSVGKMKLSTKVFSLALRRSKIQMVTIPARQSMPFSDSFLSPQDQFSYFPIATYHLKLTSR